MTWNFRARNRACSNRLFCRTRGIRNCRLGWWDAGCQRDVIAVNPGYYDQRDTELYSTQINGVPTAVPLAPNVLDSYNYSWGMPASRLTPVATLPVQ